MLGRRPLIRLLRHPSPLPSPLPPAGSLHTLFVFYVLSSSCVGLRCLAPRDSLRGFVPCDKIEKSLLPISFPLRMCAAQPPPSNLFAKFFLFERPLQGLRSTMFRPPLPECSFTQGKTRRSHIKVTQHVAKLLVHAVSQRRLWVLGAFWLPSSRQDLAASRAHAEVRTARRRRDHARPEESGCQGRGSTMERSGMDCTS